MNMNSSRARLAEITMLMKKFLSNLKISNRLMRTVKRIIIAVYEIV